MLIRMLIRKKHIIRYYTVVEVMVAMAIFLVMMTIMMQFFTSAQKVWSAASKRNTIYSDARVAMNLMTREIQSMLYDNDNDGTGIYPFWHEWTDISADGNSRPEIDAYFLANNDFSAQSGGVNSGKSYLTALNFISTTDLKPVDEGSDVCEIRYKFIPIYFTIGSPTSVNDVKGGTLQRSCTPEYYKTKTLTSTNDYNFSAYPYIDFSTPLNRVKLIWPASAPTTASTDFATVISGVYSLRFTCYAWFHDPTPTPDNSSIITLYPMDVSGNATNGNPIVATGEPPLYFPYTYNLSMGTPAPVAVRIDMKLMDPRDLKKLAYNIYVAAHGTTSQKKDAERQIRALKQKMRTFSKVIYLGKREN